MRKVTIIDYGMGNILSVKRAFEYCGAEVLVSNTEEDIVAAELLVLPGVGAFADGMEGLAQKGLIEPIQNYCSQNRPFLGICLGMQMMLDESEEFGKHQGLGVIRGKVVRIPEVNSIGIAHKVPHVGWNKLVPANYEDSEDVWKNTIMNKLTSGDSAYFVHSYYAVLEDKTHKLAECWYGGLPITAVIKKGNIYGCQFHPEKSGRVGLSIIDEFLRTDER